MTKENPFQRWDRHNKLTLCDQAKVELSIPQARRLAIWISVSCIAVSYLASMIFDFIGHDHDTLWSLLRDLMTPHPLVLVIIAFNSLQFAAARKSRLTDEEARALAEELDEMYRVEKMGLKDKEFAKWLLLGDKHKPDWMGGDNQDSKDAQKPKTE